MASLSNHISEEEKQLLRSFSSQKSDVLPKSKPKKRNLRVFEIAEEFGLESKVVCEKLWEIDERVKGPSSTVIQPVYRKLKAALILDGHRSSSDAVSDPSSQDQKATQHQKVAKNQHSRPSELKNSENNQNINQPKPRKHRPKGFVFEKRLLELELSRYSINPTSASREKVFVAFENLQSAVAKYAPRESEKNRLLKKIHSELDQFKKAGHLPKKKEPPLFTKDAISISDKALKPYVALQNKTPDGPLSESYWDNPLQDK